MWSVEYYEHQQRPFGREKLNQVRKLFFENNLSEGLSYHNFILFSVAFSDRLPLTRSAAPIIRPNVTFLML